MFRARLPSIFITSHKMPRLPRNLHVVTTWRSPDNAICKEHAARHVWSAPAACHAKRPWRSPKNATHLLKTKSTAPATQSDFWHVIKHVWMSQSATPATRNEATRRLEPPQVTPFAELAIGTAIATSRERLRTVANVNATSSEHTLNPQTPRVKREPCYAFGKNTSPQTIMGHVFPGFWHMYKFEWTAPPHEQRVNVIFRLPGIYTPQEKLKDRITPQGNFFQYWAPNVVAGTGKEGKTKEVVEDREVKQSCVCVTKLYVKDGVWQRKMVCVCVWQSCVWKMVCVKVVCERERVTKLCVKDGVWQSWVWKMVCERWCVTKMVCERGGVTDGVVKNGVCDKVVCEGWCGERWWKKWCVKDGLWRCVKDGVWQSGVWMMVCQRWWDKVEGQPWCVTKLCVKDGVSKMVGDKVVCERWCVKDVVWQSWVWKMVCDKDGVCERGCVKDGVWKMVCEKSGVWKMVCDKDGVWQQSQPSAISATPATQNAGGCRQVPHLPRERKAHVAKCHACHAKCRGVTGD